MELVYLWVEDYKNIQKQGFNFSPRFECTFHDEYDEEGKLKDNCKLEIIEKKEDEYIKDFFAKNINVTAIVGKNGSGKSNLLDLILHPVAGKQFIIFSDNRYFYFSGVTEDISKISISDILNNSSKKISFINNISSINSLRTIYYDNLLSIDYKKKYFPSSISEFHKNASLSSRIYHSNSLKLMKEEQKYFRTIYEQYETLKSVNLQNIISLLQNKSMKLPFSIPQTLKVKVKPLLLEDNDFIKSYFTNINSSFILNDISDYIKSAILNNFFTYKVSMKYIDDIYDEIKLAFNEEAISNVYDKISNLMLQEKWIEGNNFKGQVNPYINIFIQANDFLSLIDKCNYDEDSQSLFIKIKDIPNDFMYLYELVIGMGIEFLEFSFNYELSGGEESFLSFFAILYEKQLLKYTDTKITDNIILVIDEYELGLHPQWQKKYLFYIVKFLKDNFLNNKIHIILTTHSPFLLSDIPKQNIIFLDKDEKGNCKVVNGLKEKKQTFGANIHTLLSDSFFMEDGLMGEFAKGKIDEVIRLLNKDKLDEKDLKYCEQIISIIGEPIVKNQLQRMLDSKRLKKVDEIDVIKKSMEEMQKRLDELENDKNI